MLKNSIVVCVNHENSYGYLAEHSVYKIVYLSPCRRYCAVLVRNPKTGHTSQSPLFYTHRFDVIA